MTGTSNRPKSQTLNFSGSLLIRNIFYNLMGQVLPMSAALFSIPFLVHGLGTERFGVLTLAWMVVGYFSLFNMGIGRATTKFVAEYIARGALEELPPLIWTSIIMLFSLGLIGGSVIALITPWLVIHLLKIPDNLINETLKVFYMLAVSVPFVLCTAGSRGVLEAQQRFRLVNTIKIPASIANFITPLLVLPFSRNLYPIVALLTASRVLVFLVYLYFCMRSLPDLKRPRRLKAVYMKKLMRFGGWLTVSNVISPFLTYMDRFFIGAFLSMSAVAYYTTPYDLASKLLIIPGSILGVMFPVFSAYSTTNDEKIIDWFVRTAKTVLIAMAPITIVLVAMARPFLDVWLGNEFAQESTLVLQIISIGILINSVAWVPLATIQAIGRPDLTAKLHLLEFPVYLGALLLLIQKTGIYGVAIAWLLRITLDTMLLFYLAHWTLRPVRSRYKELLLLVLVVVGTAFSCIYITQVIRHPLSMVLIVFGFMTAYLIYVWRSVFNSSVNKLVKILNLIRS